jgi:predicted TIM-barrel fold metal-dependent hydrolase
MTGGIRGAFLALLLLGTSPVRAQDAQRADPAPRADHHMHIQSKLITDQLRAMQAAEPDIFDGISGDLFAERSGEDALRELDRAGIDKGVLLSTGYMFGFSGVAMEPAVRAKRMRGENRYNVDAALASKGRLFAFVGINPFAANAIDELEYWSHQPGASGIKLHLGNSGFDAADAGQVETLGRFVAAASKARLPLVIHLRGAAPFSATSVNIFIDKILSQAGDLPVQVAHGGGYAGIDQPTLDALAAYGDAIARKAPGTANLVLDISAVMQFDPSKMPGAKESTDKRSYDELRAIYVAGMRKIGLDRFVLASDWPALGSPAGYFATEQKVLPVTPAEWVALCKNLAPYLRPEWVRK